MLVVLQPKRSHTSVWSKDWSVPSCISGAKLTGTSCLNWIMNLLERDSHDGSNYDIGFNLIKQVKETWTSFQGQGAQKLLDHPLHLKRWMVRKVGLSWVACGPKVSPCLSCHGSGPTVTRRTPRVLRRNQMVAWSLPSASGFTHTWKGWRLSPDATFAVGSGALLCAAHMHFTVMCTTLEPQPWSRRS